MRTNTTSSVQEYFLGRVLQIRNNEGEMYKYVYIHLNICKEQKTQKQILFSSIFRKNEQTSLSWVKKNPHDSDFYSFVGKIED